MSILSTSSKLVRVGDSYSAGEGISIENNTISVTGDYGHIYYPGENISISDDNVISSKDWSSDIDTAAQNASAETTAWVSEQGYITDASLSDYALITDVETTSGLLKMDIDTVSGSISGKMDSTAFNDWQNGQYANDIAGLTNDVGAVSGAVNDLSATVSSLDIPTHQEIIDASGYAYSQSTAWVNNQGYLTQHQDISYLATKNEVDTVSSFLSGAIDYVSANAGGEFPASANDAITAYQTYSGTYLTAHQSLDGYLTKSSADTLYQPIGSYASQTDLEQVSGDLKDDIDYISGVAITALPGDLATTGDISDLAQSISETYQPIGDYLTNADSANFYPMTGNPSGFITGVDLSNYYTKSQTSGATELADAFANIPAGDADVNAYVQGNSATINDVNTTVQTNSADWASHQDLSYISGQVDNKLDTTAFSTVSGTFLTAHQAISANEWNSVYDTVESNSGSWTGGGGGSIDTIPVVAISPLVTGFSGESAYLGIESTALNLSSYVPVSAIGVDSNYGWVNKISGRNISAYNAATAQYAYTANRSYLDRNGNEITSYYQPKLTITGDAGTITSINGSAVGASIPEGWELVAGQGIEIVDDAENNQTTISVTAAGGNPEVESYVQTNSASIDDAVSSYQTNSAVFNAKQDALTFGYDEQDRISAINNSALAGGGSSLTGDAQGALDEVYSSSGIWNDVTGKENAITYGWSANAISSINGSAIIGEPIPYEVYGISAGDNIGIWEQNNALWISGKDWSTDFYAKTDTSSKTELNNAIGNIETLLASL